HRHHPALHSFPTTTLFRSCRPLVRLLAASSAVLPQHTTSNQSVSSRLNCRVTAREKLVTALPLWVYRSAGSAPKRPISATVFIREPPAGCRRPALHPAPCLRRSPAASPPRVGPAIGPPICFPVCPQRRRGERDRRACRCRSFAASRRWHSRSARRTVPHRCHALE